VETLYWIRDILDKGAAWFAAQGLPGHKGLRSYSVSGRVNEPGVKIAPAGISVRELIERHCGGMQEGHRFAAYLPGGASGGILPAEHGDVPLDFGGRLAELGCFVGSHAVVVLSDQDDVHDVAANLMAFFARESCGQCTPCRDGATEVLRMLEAGNWDAARLGDLEAVMRDASICGLGQAAPNPFASVLRHFAERP
jgi:formate dehydrogenase